jgi:phage replication-related protein YjqB (UPF0714/DUF867 family)
MADTYLYFAELERSERAGIDYGIRLRRAKPEFAIVAPHGGGIEPGTSEIADAIAGEQWSFYTLEGLKSSGNAVLHITSTRFDEPMCLTLVGRSSVVLTVHGEESGGPDGVVFIGGRDTALGASVRNELTEDGFLVREHEDPNLQGTDPKNICNRGTSGAGVQLELSRSVRESMFESLTKKGRERPTERFDVFVKAVRRVLG